jgi:GNAT superfamily N-acetyltransferase
MTDTMRYSIRQATISDAAVIAHHRVAMFQDMGDVPTVALSTELLSASIPALSVLLREGSYVGWLAIDTGERVIAGAGVHVRPQLPLISQDGGRVVATPVPLVVNVYTEPAWRRKGIARALMQGLMDWSVVQGFDRLLLHASDAGRDLYVSLGFGPSNEMRWPPKQGDFTPSSNR